MSEKIPTSVRPNRQRKLRNLMVTNVFICFTLVIIIILNLYILIATNNLSESLKEQPLRMPLLNEIRSEEIMPEEIRADDILPEEIKPEVSISGERVPLVGFSLVLSAALSTQDEWEEYQEESLAEYDVTEYLGDPIITTPLGYLEKKSLPSDYYPGVNFSYFKSYEHYRGIGKYTESGRVTHSDNAYTDEVGLRRYKVENEFGANYRLTDYGEIICDDDYIVAMGNYYKEKGRANQRFLIVTDDGSFTVRVGDEKDDSATDPYNMFTWHNHYAGPLEFIVDQRILDRNIQRHGTVSRGPVGVLSNDIEYIYRIHEKS